MTAEEFSYILNELKPYTKYIYYHLMGEPLTHPELPLFLNIAEKNGFKSVITTNGTLLSQRKEELLSQNIHKLSISVHSFEDGSEESFRSYINNIASVAEEFSKKGTIVVLRFWNNGYDDDKKASALSLIKERLCGEWEDNSKGIRVHEKLYIEWGDRFDWPDIDAPVQGEEFFCYGMRDHFGILCDGTVVPCCLDSDGIINLGNIFNQGIDEILNSERARKIEEFFSCRKASEELCKRCGYAQRFVRSGR